MKYLYLLAIILLVFLVLRGILFTALHFLIPLSLIFIGIFLIYKRNWLIGIVFIIAGVITFLI